MTPVALSALVEAGLLTKKDRIRCCYDRDVTAITWLRRQRFKVEEGVPDMPGNGGKHEKRLLYDVLIADLDTPTITADNALRTYFQTLKPGGRFLICVQNGDLFDNTIAAEVKSRLEALFARETTAAITRLEQKADETTDIYVVKKGGVYKPRLPVRYIDEPEPFARACDSLLHVPVIGLDVETTLTTPRILCTVQLATEELIYLIDALPLKDLAPLKRLMEDAQVLKIIHNKTFEEKVLDYYGIRINNIYDTLIESRKRHKKKTDGGHKLGEVCERELGIYLDKSLQASDWTIRPLSSDQRDYAAVDAEVLLRLYRLFVPPPEPENLELF